MVDPNYRSLRSKFEQQVFQATGGAGYSRLHEALDLMEWLHEPQAPRPDGTPYVYHPLAVAQYLVDCLRIHDIDTLIAALLHDSVEDQEKRLASLWSGPSLGSDRADAFAYLGQTFGNRVARLVLSVTNPDFGNNTGNKAKRQLYFDHVVEIFDTEIDGFLIKCADLSQNAFKLYLISDWKFRKKLEKKYKPVLEFIYSKIVAVSDPKDPLTCLKGRYLNELYSAIQSM